MRKRKEEPPSEMAMLSASPVKNGDLEFQAKIMFTVAKEASVQVAKRALRDLLDAAKKFDEYPIIIRPFDL